MRESASNALSIPVALSEAPLRPSSSSWDRSRPRDGAAVFLPADLAPAPLGFDGWEASSSRSWASRSAFLRAASAFLASASSLFFLCYSSFLIYLLSAILRGDSTDNLAYM